MLTATIQTLDDLEQIAPKGREGHMSPHVLRAIRAEDAATIREIFNLAPESAIDFTTLNESLTAFHRRFRDVKADAVIEE